MRIVILTIAIALASVICAHAADPTATQPALATMPHVQVDVKARQVRVECEAINAENQLEFLCSAPGKEHETLLNTDAKPSHIHLGLLMLGLKPGEPIRYSEALKKWLPPKGPPVQITIQYNDNGKVVSMPAYRMLRDFKSKKEMPPTTWVFCGSTFLEDNTYAADTTGYVVTLVNFDMSLIDVPAVASNSNEALEWEINPDRVPPKKARVWMVIEPAGGKGADTPATSPSTQPSARLSDVSLDEARVATLKSTWKNVVLPHRAELALAAQTHYEVINSLRREQQRLIDEADRVQRVVDELEKEYQNMTTPRPAAAE